MPAFWVNTYRRIEHAERQSNSTALTARLAPSYFLIDDNGLTWTRKEAIDCESSLLERSKVAWNAIKVKAVLEGDSRAVVTFASGRAIVWPPFPPEPNEGGAVFPTIFNEKGGIETWFRKGRDYWEKTNGKWLLTKTTLTQWDQSVRPNLSDEDLAIKTDGVDYLASTPKGL